MCKAWKNCGLLNLCNNWDRREFIRLETNVGSATTLVVAGSSLAAVLGVQAPAGLHPFHGCFICYAHLPLLGMFHLALHLFTPLFATVLDMWCFQLWRLRASRPLGGWELPSRHSWTFQRYVLQHAYKRLARFLYNYIILELLDAFDFALPAMCWKLPCTVNRVPLVQPSIRHAAVVWKQGVPRPNTDAQQTARH